MAGRFLRVEKIEKVYRDGENETFALRDISFYVEKGEFVAIIGPSGSGKSTLLHILGFLDQPTHGQYYFEGKSIEEFSDADLARIRNKKIGFVFQAFNLLPRTSVFDNVKLPLLYSDLSLSLRNETVKRAIEAVGLSGRLSHESSQLSGGEKQRVAIARALVNNPSVIFADEPTGNLDSKSGAAVVKILKELNDRGHTIFLITHETYTAEYAKRIIRLFDGKIESDRVVSRRRSTAGQFIK